LETYINSAVSAASLSNTAILGFSEKLICHQRWLGNRRRIRSNDVTLF